MSTKERVLGVLKELKIQIKEDGTLAISSLSFVELLIQIESSFQIEIPPQAVHEVDFRNLNSILRYLESRKNE